MNNENENNEGLKAEGFSFKVSEPLTGDDKKRIYKMIMHALANFRKVDLMYQVHIPDSVPNARVKRAVAMAACISEFLVEYMEQKGCCVNLDSATMQGMLTPILIIAPAIACNSLDEITEDEGFMAEFNDK